MDNNSRPRVDASSARLTSLRTTNTDLPNAASRRPKFVPKAVKRRTVGEVSEGGHGPERRERTSDYTSRPQRAGDLTRGGRGGRDMGGDGRVGGRGRGRGRGRGAHLPTGKVTFVGSMSGGSSFSGPTMAPRINVKSSTAADGLGISVLDEENIQHEFEAMQVEEVWPPLVNSIMEPMSLSFARRPEPPTVGAGFCDETGQHTIPNDSLLFLQLPTTLPLANAKRAVKIEDMQSQVEESKPINKFAVSPAASEVKKEATKEKTEETAEDTTNPPPSDAVYDNSIATAPGGFIGKLCIHRSGKTVLMLGDMRFDVASAHTPAFAEELYSIDTEEQQLCMLGAVGRHLVVTPDFEALLA